MTRRIRISELASSGFTISPLIFPNSPLNYISIAPTLLKPARDGCFAKKVKESRYENMRSSLERNSRFVRNFVAHVSRLARTRSILASFAQAQRPAVRLLLQLVGLEACATSLQLAPIRDLPDRSRQIPRRRAGKNVRSGFHAM